MKIIKYIKYPPRIIVYLQNRLNFKLLSDKTYLKILYKTRINKKLNLKNPQAFNEKIQWLKIYDRNPLYTTLVDKYEVKEYVADKIGKEYIIPTIGVWDKFEDIDFEKLPTQFVLKCTHDSGGIIICKDKNKLNLIEAKDKINNSLKKNYYYYGREWPYKNVKPRIIVEKYMVDESDSQLKDYKFFCFNGEVKLIQVDFDRFNNHKRNIYDINWNLINLEIEYPSDRNKSIEKPKMLKKMIEVCQILSKGLTHVRVDLYNTKENIYFGELTFYHGSGCEHFKPIEWDLKLGKMINLPKREAQTK